MPKTAKNTVKKPCFFRWGEVDFAVFPDGGALRKASVREGGERHFLHRASRETTAGGISSFQLFHANRHPKMGACLWWEEVDSNHRSRRRQIYSLIHLAALESSRMKL